MTPSVLLAFGLALLASLPGLILILGRSPAPGQLAAAATVSLTTNMLITALIGFVLYSVAGVFLPAWSIGPVALVMTIAAWLITRPQVRHLVSFPEWQGVAFVLLFAGFGLVTQMGAVVHQGDGSLAIHAWFNADWFKHLGHVHALANYGVPARDSFGGAEPLHYYWLFYLLPGGAAQLGGNGWAALVGANIFVAGLLAATLYGSIRMCCRNRNLALLICCLAVTACVSLGYATFVFSAESIATILNAEDAPRGPALLAMSQYIPQHTLAAAVYLSWLILSQPAAHAPRSVRIMALAAMAALLAVSILLGAMLLCAYGLMQLWRLRQHAIPELMVMALASASVMLVIGVVQFGNPGSAIESPLLTNSANFTPWYLRIVATIGSVAAGLGLPLLLGIFAFSKWQPDEPIEVFVRDAAVALVLAAILGLVGAELLLTERLALEVQIRAINLPAVALALVGSAVLMRSFTTVGRTRLLAALSIAAIVLAALPGAVFRTVWHFQISDKFTTTIPADDLAVLASLRQSSDPRAQVWQYPEPPFLANPSGDDVWAVTIAGRTVPGSLRATDYGLAAPLIKGAQDYFSRTSNFIPAAVDWVYLSRVLHPTSYDELNERLDADPLWDRVSCYADACLYHRSIIGAK